MRHSKLSKKEGGAGQRAGQREVVQYQYTAWPDHDTPHNIPAVLSFIKKSSAATQVTRQNSNVYIVCIFEYVYVNMISLRAVY